MALTKTTVTNITAGPLYFGFIPPHGRTLESAEAYDITGDIASVLASGLGNPNRNREIASMEAAVDAGYCTVEVTPGSGPDPY